MKRKQVEDFEKLDSQMQALFEEFGTLARKKPDDAVNPFKLKIANSLIVKANEILGEKYQPLQGFKEFDEVAVPTNSDVVMVCGQYLSCLEKLRADNITDNFGTWYWLIDGKKSEMRTARPKKISERD